MITAEATYLLRTDYKSYLDSATVAFREVVSSLAGREVLLKGPNAENCYTTRMPFLSPCATWWNADTLGELAVMIEGVCRLLPIVTAGQFDSHDRLLLLGASSSDVPYWVSGLARLDAAGISGNNTGQPELPTFAELHSYYLCLRDRADA